MTGLMWRVLRDRWQLLVGTLCAISLGVALVHSGLSIATTVAAAQPPAGLSRADRASYLARLDGTNTINGIASILGIFLTVFVVRSTIDFAVTERRRELALLRLAGVTRRQLRRMLLGEATVLGVIGTLVGCAAGQLLAAGQRALYVGMGIMPADVHVAWSPVHLLLDAVVGVGVAVAGARAASLRATRISPLEALHHRGAEARPMNRSRWLWGSLAAVATVAQLVATVAVGGFLGPLLLGLGIIITGSVAASQFAPVLVPAAAGLAGHLVPGTLGELAVAKLRDDARRTAQVAAPLVVLVGLVGGLQGLLDTQTRAGEVELTRTTRADILVTTHGDPSSRIAALPGVASADAQVQVPAAVTIGGQGGQRLSGSVWALDPARFAAMHPYRAARGSLDAFDDGHVVIGPGIEDLQLRGTTGDVTVTIAGRRHRLAEAARTGEGLAATEGVYISRALVPPDVLAGSPATVLVTLATGADALHVRDAINRLRLGSVTTSQDAAAHRDATKTDENRSVMAALVGVGSVYALISLLSTLAVSTAQRRSEFAIDRLTGLTRRQVTRVALLETLVTMTIGLSLGTVVSLAALVGLWFTTWRAFGTPAISVPWLLLLGMGLLVTSLASATTWASARTATDRPPVHDITTKE